MDDAIKTFAVAFDALAIDPHPFAAMRAFGGRWVAYRNEDLGHRDVGRLAFLRVGQGCTYEVPPAQYPDTADVGLGWRYRLVGEVDFVAGKVVLNTRKE